MTTMAEAERRATVAIKMREAGKSYTEIAEALGLSSRGHVNYYLNLDKRRQRQRQFYVKNLEARREYDAAYRERKRTEFSLYGDRTGFKPETPRQSRMWAELLGGR
jgi:hypothetical protein